jgi:crossover junction endodeoxyribonuclease RuvC
MVVLGIDPGSINCGFALIASKGRGVELIESGILTFDTSTDFPKRVGEIYLKMKALIAELKPDSLSFESLILTKSPTSAIKLAQARGAMFAAAAEVGNFPIFEYAPNEIKQCIAGHGHADKAAMLKAVNFFIRDFRPKGHDESDALAIALCHYLNHDRRVVGQKKSVPKSKTKGLANALSHLIKEKDL